MELELARELDPLSPIIRNDTGLALVHQHRHAEAIRTFEEALELDTAFWRAHHDLGITCVLWGDPGSGVEHLEHAWRMGTYGKQLAL